MSVRVKRYSQNGIEQTEWVERPLEQRETTVDGQTFHWGMNEVRNFLDDGVGLAHAAFGDSAQDDVVQDSIPFGSSRS